MNAKRLKQLISNFDKQILVVGDVMLDRFVWGSVNRFSPEAPTCPVLEFSEEVVTIGGAANVAANLAALGAKCIRLVGAIGYDNAGLEIRWLLDKMPKIDNDLQTVFRPTTEKIRYVAEGQHLLRFDRESQEPLSERDEKLILSKIRHWLPLVSAVVLEDYGKGVLTPSLIRAVIKLAADANTPIFVDPKKDHWEHYRGVEILKPNLVEAKAAAGRPEGSLSELGPFLLNLTRANAIVITQGKDGMTSFCGQDVAQVIPSPVAAIDLSGAGDTTMAALTLAKLAGASLVEAMQLANMAAGLAVQKKGTSVVTAEELLTTI